MNGNDSQNAFESAIRPLWTRAQAGDEVAYRQALTRIAARLRVYFRHRLKSLPDDVEDLVQETLLALHVQRGTYDPRLPVGAWVFAIAHHKLVDLWRRRGRREALHDPIDDLDQLHDPAGADDGSTAQDLDALLERLPAAQRQAIVMTRLEGLSMSEASIRSGVSVSALKVQVHRGLKRLARLVLKES